MYLFETYFVCVLFLFTVSLFALIIIGCRFSNNVFQRLSDLTVIDLHVGKYDGSVFHAPCGLHDNMIRPFEFDVLRSEIIYLSGRPESDSYHFCHFSSPL